MSVSHGPNIVLVKTLCSIVQEAPENIAQEKILFNVVSVLLGQHCAGKNPVQYCPWGSRQQCTGKNPVQSCLNTFGDNITQVKILWCVVQQETPENIAQEKILFNVVLILLDNIVQVKTFAMLSTRLQTTLHMKKSYSISSEQNNFTAIFILDWLIF